jgi:SSS family solute:Na+ symporter
MHWIDWSIAGALMALMIAIAIVSSRLMRSVADFMAAGRHVGRYLLSISLEMASIGAVSVVAMFEQFYESGFVGGYWYLVWWFVSLAIAMSGWVTYRFRQTRALTMAQFFEMRYSRRFRIFAGVLAFSAGLVNFGIFPAVGARFFIYFCGLPQYVSLGGLEVSSFVLVMLVLLTLALAFTFLGGQIAVTLTDYTQGIFFSFVLLVVIVLLARSLTWTQVSEALLAAPPDESLVHPFRTSKIEDFNAWYFLIGAFALVYNHMAWQGNQGYFCAAKSPHEARMGRILFTWRQFIEKLLLILLPIFVYTMLHHHAFAADAAEVRSALSQIENDQIAKQMLVPVGLRQLLPTGAMGCLCAVMLAAFVTTHDTYLHSWGTILIQDVAIPLRRKPLTPRQHLLLLRLSICGVAVFIFFFSLLFRQTQHVYMFFAITGAIYLGGAGAVILGGLYWRRGTAAAAWSSMIVGSTLAVSAIVIKQISLDRVPNDLLRQALAFVESINGQILFGIAMGCSIVTYVAVSLLGPRQAVDLDRILHRGRYKVESDDVTERVEHHPRSRWYRWLGMNDEFTRGDRFIYVVTTLWTAGWMAVFVALTVGNLVTDVTPTWWAGFWYRCMWVAFVVGVITSLWFLIGGLRDLYDLLHRLRTAVRDASDDGTVHQQPSATAPEHTE